MLTLCSVTGEAVLGTLKSGSIAEGASYLKFQ